MFDFRSGRSPGTRSSRFLLFRALAAVAGSLGCANPGPPRPPSLDLPATVRDLEVVRVGGDVEARWTTPRLTSEKTVIKGPVTALLCAEAVTAPSRSGAPALSGSNAPAPSRSISPAGSASLGSPPGCNPVARKIVSPGPSAVLIHLPADLLAGAPRLLLYRVELMNSQGRSAGKGNSGWSAAGAAPPAVGPISVAATRDGALIRWQRAPTSVAGERVVLSRTNLNTGSGAPPAKPRSSGLAHTGAAKLSPSARPSAEPQSTSVRLAAGVEPESQRRSAGDAELVSDDSGGLLDRSVQPGVQYTYLAQRVREVTLLGHQVHMLGEPSPTESLLYRDVFPPTPPVGLEAVPVGGFAQASDAARKLSLDLSWEPSPEPDVAGYNVYRSTAGGAFVRMNSAPIAVPAYRDTAVQPGKLYRYRVSAVDTNRNESLPGPELEQELHPE